MTPRSPSRFTIGAETFRHGTLSAADEFHCVRRVAPVVKNTGAFVTALAAQDALHDGRLRLADVAKMNDQLAARSENRIRAHRAAEDAAAQARGSG